MTARDRITAMVMLASDEDAAELERRLDAYRAEVLSEVAQGLARHPNRATADLLLGRYPRAAEGGGDCG